MYDIRGLFYNKVLVGLRFPRIVLGLPITDIIWMQHYVSGKYSGNYSLILIQLSFMKAFYSLSLLDLKALK